jgi:hypothetical protein
VRADLSTLPTEQLAYLYGQKLEEEAEALYRARQAAEQAGTFRAELVRRLTVGEVIQPEGEDWQVVCLPPRAGNRSVDKDAVLHHAEALEPLGLAPRETTKLTWCTVAQIDAAEHALRRIGIDPAELVVPGAAGEPRIEVRSVEGAR